jgi:acetyltransferase-like isoleucine patch superfamily enzyme
MSIFIHESAHVSPAANIGNGTKIWINSQVREYAVIGENCITSKDTYIDEHVVIGKRVKIQNGVSVYHGVTIEDDVFVGPNVTFTNDHVPRAFNASWKISQTIVRKGASIGANATIVCGITVGEYAMIGAGSVVVKNVAPYTLVVGNPARQIGYVCKCGARLSSGEVCNQCGALSEVSS